MFPRVSTEHQIFFFQCCYLPTFFSLIIGKVKHGLIETEGSKYSLDGDKVYYSSLSELVAANSDLFIYPCLSMSLDVDALFDEKKQNPDGVTDLNTFRKTAPPILEESRSRKSSTDLMTDQFLDEIFEDLPLHGGGSTPPKAPERKDKEKEFPQ